MQLTVVHILSEAALSFMLEPSKELRTMTAIIRMTNRTVVKINSLLILTYESSKPRKYFILTIFIILFYKK